MTRATLAPPADGPGGAQGARPKPFVSVIVPVRDAARRAERMLPALLAQDYPPERREVIVVDNGSRDGTAAVARRFPVRLLSEPSVASPYVARNAGIAAARGEVLAFLDVNCFPAPGWLSSAVAALEAGADLVGGRVTFTFPDGPGPAALFDAVSNVKMESSIRERGVAKGGNLVVWRRVVDTIGPFPPDARSGGDVRWTARATEAGLRLVYAPEAEAFYPARNLGALLRKQYRVGRGQPGIWLERGEPLHKVLARIVLGVRPPPRRAIRQRLETRAGVLARSPGAVWWVAWACMLAENAGRLDDVVRRALRRGSPRLP